MIYYSFATSSSVPLDSFVVVFFCTAQQRHNPESLLKSTRASALFKWLSTTTKLKKKKKVITTTQSWYCYKYSPILFTYFYSSLSCLFKHYSKHLPLSSAPYTIPNLSTLSRQSCLLSLTWPFARSPGTSSLNDLILQNKTK